MEIFEKIKDIHYLWVGEPTEDDFFAIPGHDIAGPIEMAKKLESQDDKRIINFWCLEEHKKFYDKEFNEHGVNINVCSIQSLLEEKITSQDLKEPAEFVRQLMEETFYGKTKKIEIELYGFIMPCYSRA